jgi:hypothetical protein
VLLDDRWAPSLPEKVKETAEETVDEGAMLTQAQVRGLVRSRFWTGFLSGVAMVVCASWLKWLLLSTVL